jgi:hypothetical protein
LTVRPGYEPLYCYIITSIIALAKDWEKKEKVKVKEKGDDQKDEDKKKKTEEDEQKLIHEIILEYAHAGCLLHHVDRLNMSIGIDRVKENIERLRTWRMQR